MKTAMDVKVDQDGNAVIPLGDRLRGQEVHIVFEVGASAFSSSDAENNEIVPAETPLAGAAYRGLVADLYGSWDGELFEPLDPPLQELGPLL